jgi:TM2 domain-containing membrane protein YozV
MFLVKSFRPKRPAINLLYFKHGIVDIFFIVSALIKHNRYNKKDDNKLLSLDDRVNIIWLADKGVI